MQEPVSENQENKCRRERKQEKTRLSEGEHLHQQLTSLRVLDGMCGKETLFST